MPACGVTIPLSFTKYLELRHCYRLKTVLQVNPMKPNLQCSMASRTNFKRRLTGGVHSNPFLMIPSLALHPKHFSSARNFFTSALTSDIACSCSAHTATQLSKGLGRRSSWNQAWQGGEHRKRNVGCGSQHVATTRNVAEPRRTIALEQQGGPVEL